MLPKRKQMLALSATYTPALLTQLEELMHEPRQVLLCPETVSLLGVRQFYSRAPGEPSQMTCSTSILSPVCAVDCTKSNHRMNL